MKIVFISDIHFGELAVSPEFSFEGEELKDGVIEKAKPLLQGIVDELKNVRPDYLFIAGDLTSTGSPLEFEHCLCLIEKLSDAIGVSLDHILFCIGNHDIDWRITRIIDQYEKKEYCQDDLELLSRYYKNLAQSTASTIMNKDLHRNIVPKYNENSNIPYAGVIEYSDCIVFVLNSAIEGHHLQDPKHGSLGQIQLDWFERVAKEKAKESKPKICLLHHHPRLYNDYLPTMDISELEESERLVHICEKNGISLILHGHKHQPHAITRYENGWATPVTFICAGSLSVNYSQRMYIIPNTFHIIDYQDEKHIQLINYCYTPQRGWFHASYSDELPIDDRMLLGTVIKPDEAKSIIEKIPQNCKVTYESLDERLKYFPRKELERLINIVFPTIDFVQKEDCFWLMEDK